MDLKRKFLLKNLVPVVVPIYLNRSGSFTVDVDVTERLQKKNLKFQFPLKVLEVK